MTLCSSLKGPKLFRFVLEQCCGLRSHAKEQNEYQGVQTLQSSETQRSETQNFQHIRPSLPQQPN